MPTPYPSAADYDRAECDRAGNGYPRHDGVPRRAEYSYWPARDCDQEQPRVGNKLGQSPVFLIRRAIAEGRPELFYIRKP